MEYLLSVVPMFTVGYVRNIWYL